MVAELQDGSGPGGVGEPLEVPVPRQHEPRDPDPDERGAGDGRAAAEVAAHSGSEAHGRGRAPIRRVAARDHQRHPRLLPHRGGQARARDRGARPARGHRGRRRVPRSPRPRQGPRAAVPGRGVGPAGRARRPRPPAAGPHQPGRQRGEVHRPRRGDGARAAGRGRPHVAARRVPGPGHRGGYLPGGGLGHLRRLRPGRRVHHPQVRGHRPGPRPSASSWRASWAGTSTSRARPGRASSFRFTARFAKAESPGRRSCADGASLVGRRSRARGVGPPRASPTFQARVLLVEDSPVNQAVAEGMLALMGCEVETAADGQEALAAVEKGGYDLVLMDCMMPVVDGFEATAELRRREREDPSRARTTVVALTASAMSGDRERCLTAGMDDYLSKPFREEALRALLARWLSARTSGHEEANVSNDVEVLPTPKARPAPDAHGTPPPPAIDPSALEALRALQAPGAPDIRERVIGLYLQQTPRQLEDLRSALAGGDTSAVARAAHTVKSSSANVGAMRLSALCRELESVAGERGRVRGRPPCRRDRGRVRPGRARARGLPGGRGGLSDRGRDRRPPGRPRCRRRRDDAVPPEGGARAGGLCRRGSRRRPRGDRAFRVGAAGPGGAGRGDAGDGRLRGLREDPGPPGGSVDPDPHAHRARRRRVDPPRLRGRGHRFRDEAVQLGGARPPRAIHAAGAARPGRPAEERGAPGPRPPDRPARPLGMGRRLRPGELVSGAAHDVRDGPRGVRPDAGGAARARRRHRSGRRPAASAGGRRARHGIRRRSSGSPARRHDPVRPRAGRGSARSRRQCPAG